MLNRQFTKITTGTALSNLGSFASISSDAKSFALGANIVTDRTVWGLQLSGGATEGIFKLFNNEVNCQPPTLLPIVNYQLLICSLSTANC